MERIFVTGGNGFFASRFKTYYANQYEIMAVGKEVLNVKDENRVMEFTKDYQPDYVIHTAAIPDTNFCNNNPKICNEINFRGSINIAKACETVGAGLVFISTEQVFNGNRERGPYRELDSASPNTVYGENKLRAERVLKKIIKELWILRFTWLFGLPERGKKINPNILWNTVEALINGNKIRVSDNEYRGLTYIYDLLEQFNKVFDLPYGLYHIGSDNNISRYEIVKFILRQLGMGDRIEQLLEKDEERYKEYPRDIRLNTDKIKSMGFVFPSSKRALKRCLRDFDLLD